MTNTEELLGEWLPYLETITNWEDVVRGIEPKLTGCGQVYELSNPINRPDESFAIADMTDVKVTEPHYHANGETEIYIVLQGVGLAVVGKEEQHVEKGTIVVTPPNTVHYIIPGRELILAVINTPPFKSENYTAVTRTDDAVGFDEGQFRRLSE